MKFAAALSLIGTVSAENITLKHVYGDIEPVTSMTPYWQQRNNRATIASPFLAKRASDNCIFPIELVLVQDATSSFSDNFHNMATTQLRLMTEALEKSHPGSKVGVVSFRDIPIWSLGEPRTDYCQKLEQPITADLGALTALYSKMESIGGGDPPENQFGALLAAANYKEIGWNSNPDASKLVVVVTDAAPHFNADGFNHYGLATNPGTFNEATAEADCTKYYYPSPEAVKEQLKAKELYLGSLVYDSQYDHFQPRESWTWFNSFMDQVPEFYHDINQDASNFWEVLSTIITSLEDVECGPVTTTESPEGSAAGTTQAPPTTGGPEGTLPPSCGVCPNPCPPEGCDPCCLDGVLIKLRHRPARLHLEIENAPAAEQIA